VRTGAYSWGPDLRTLPAWLDRAKRLLNRILHSGWAAVSAFASSRKGFIGSVPAVCCPKCDPPLSILGEGATRMHPRGRPRGLRSGLGRSLGYLPGRVLRSRGMECLDRTGEVLRVRGGVLGSAGCHAHTGQVRCFVSGVECWDPRGAMLRSARCQSTSRIGVPHLSDPSVLPFGSEYPTSRIPAFYLSDRSTPPLGSQRSTLRIGVPHLSDPAGTVLGSEG